MDHAAQIGDFGETANRHARDLTLGADELAEFVEAQRIDRIAGG